MPKYRGDSEDWLDHEEAKNAARSRASGAKPGKTDKAKPLPIEQANATVAEVFPNQCRVRFDPVETGTEILCSYRRATVFQQGDIRERSPVAVGDRVLAVQLNPQSGIVEGVCLRRNHLSRPAPGREARGEENRKLQHTIAANVDQLVIVACAGEPAFSPGMVDRYLVAASHAGIEPLICLNKTDLVTEGDPLPTDLYRDLGYRVFELSSKKKTGIDGIRKAVQSKATVFCGQSGVGKTSLLRELVGSEIGKVGETSVSTGKGRHTTTAAILLRGSSEGSGGSQWIDTPGVREFGLAEIEPEKLKDHFPEFQGLACVQADCLHENEEDCAAKSLPRYSSYRRILASLRSGEQ